jgi:hypothetical protein
MFHFIITDPSLVDENNQPRMDSLISSHKGKMFLACHPDLVDTVKEGVFLSTGIDLEVVTKDEWDRANATES